MTAGPRRIAPRPAPVGCEQLPANDGSLSEESSRQKPAAAPRRSRAEGSRFTALTTARPPAYANGTAAAVQARA